MYGYGYWYGYGYIWYFLWSWNTCTLNNNACNRTHFKWPWNIVWFAVDLNTGYLDRWRQSPHAQTPMPPLPLGHRDLDKHPSPNGVLYEMETIWKLVIREKGMRTWNWLLLYFMLFYMLMERHVATSIRNTGYLRSLQNGRDDLNLCVAYAQ